MKKHRELICQFKCKETRMCCITNNKKIFRRQHQYFKLMSAIAAYLMSKLKGQGIISDQTTFLHPANCSGVHILFHSHYARL